MRFAPWFALFVLALLTEPALGSILGRTRASRSMVNTVFLPSRRPTTIRNPTSPAGADWTLTRSTPKRSEPSDIPATLGRGIATVGIRASSGAINWSTTS